MNKKPHKHAALIKEWADGATIEWTWPGDKNWSPIDACSPSWDVNIEYRVKPEKLYPESGMTEQELLKVYYISGAPSTVLQYRAIANAALRHAIDAGQVMPLDQHVKEMGEAHIQGIVSARATRDLAIAEAVREWYVNQFPGIRGALVQPRLLDLIAKVTT